MLIHACGISKAACLCFNLRWVRNQQSELSALKWTRFARNLAWTKIWIVHSGCRCKYWKMKPFVIFLHKIFYAFQVFDKTDPFLILSLPFHMFIQITTQKWALQDISVREIKMCFNEKLFCPMKKFRNSVEWSWVQTEKLYSAFKSRNFSPIRKIMTKSVF